MRVTINLHCLFAVLLGTGGLALITLASFGVMERAGAWLGFALLQLGGAVWLHSQINRIVERMSSREDAAYNIGKLAAVRERVN